MRIDMTNNFNPEHAETLVNIASEHGLFLKVHYTDWLKTSTLENSRTWESVGPTSTSALVKNELGIEKGAGSRKEAPVEDLSISQLIGVADKKEDSTLGRNRKKNAKEVLGTCKRMGVYVEGKEPRNSCEK